MYYIEGEYFCYRTGEQATIEDKTYPNNLETIYDVNRKMSPIKLNCAKKNGPICDPNCQIGKVLDFLADGEDIILDRLDDQSLDE